MASYNINIRAESHIADAVSVESEDLTALRLELATFVGDLLRDHAEQIWLDQEWQVDVSNEAGLLLYVLHISVMETAATSGRPLTPHR